MKFRTTSVIICAALAGCVFVPRTTAVYDKDCQIEAKQMTMDLQQIGQLGSCTGNDCVHVLVGAGAVAAASAVVSGSIVVAGNVVYWFEKEGRCLTSPPPKAASG